MLYRVMVDGNSILNFSDPSLILLSPKLELEINAAGSFEFIMPPNHRYYNSIQLLTSTVEVYEDNLLLWYGRPIEQTVDFYKQKHIYCEGPLSFFNDTIQEEQEFESIKLHDYFKTIIQKHNSSVSNPDRKFYIDNITVDNEEIYRKLDYESTYNALKGTCFDTVDGYVLFRREFGFNYIDWIKDLQYTSNQNIQYGINLLDYQTDFDASELATCVYPLGKNLGKDLGYTTIKDVNNGSPILVSEAAATYGKITRVERWSDISDPSELLNEAKKYLENTQFNSFSIECNAADMHTFDHSKDSFTIGRKVRCISNPHLMDREFPISKISIKLDSAEKQLTLGTRKKKTLTRIYKEDIEEAEAAEEALEEYIDEYIPEDEYTGIDDGYTGTDGGDFIGQDGTSWILVPPDEIGGPVTAIKMPTKIVIERKPNKMKYNPGEALDFTGIIVRAYVDDTKWNYPPKYSDGKIPFEELTFSTKKAPNIKEYTVSVIWKYNGKNYYADLRYGQEASSWTCNPNWLKTEAGVYIGAIGGRRFNKKNAGKAIAFYRWNCSGWYGPCLISDKREAVLTNQGDSITEHDYNGLHWYYQHGWHFNSSDGADVVTPRIENMPTIETEFKRAMQEAGVVVS